MPKIISNSYSCPLNMYTNCTTCTVSYYWCQSNSTCIHTNDPSCANVISYVSNCYYPANYYTNCYTCTAYYYWCQSSNTCVSCYQVHVKITSQHKQHAQSTWVFTTPALFAQMQIIFGAQQQINVSNSYPASVELEPLELTILHILIESPTGCPVSGFTTC